MIVSLLELDTPAVSFVSNGSLAFLRLPLVLLWVLPSHLRVLLVVHEEEREVRLQVGCPQSSSSASVVFRQLLKGFPLTGCARRVVLHFACIQHVLNMRASSRYTRRRLESTHGGGFPHAKPHHTTQNDTTPHHTTHHTNRTHNTTTQRTHHNNNNTHMRTTMSTHIYTQHITHNTQHTTYTYSYSYTYTHHT